MAGPMDMMFALIAGELGVAVRQVEAAARLLGEGATVPFIARYRKEATGGLDDTQLRRLEERLQYLRELEERRETVLKSIAEQDKLTPELESEIRSADTKVRIEDLYLPYRPKRRTKAQIAREAGLEPLARALMADPSLAPLDIATGFVDPDKGVPDAVAALEGARQVLMEDFSEDPDLAGRLRQFFWENARMTSRAPESKQDEGAKFSDYFKFEEPVRNIPSHRALALFRGRKEGILRLGFAIDEEREDGTAPNQRRCEAMIASRFGIQDRGRPADSWLVETVRCAWKPKLLARMESDSETRLWEMAEAEAIRVFGKNLRDLLLAAPAGPRPTMGLDPGIRTGVKVAVLDSTGKPLETATIYPHEPKRDWAGSIQVLSRLARHHGVELIAIGNGTASRETDRLVADLQKAEPDLKLTKVVVSEAGASVYSASELAAREFPNLDVSLRGAVSIARRLQDPLAELVKIDAKAIGVGQYQHDVSQPELARTLDAVVEDCVNAVGVDLNTASPHLLGRISGLSATLAANIVSYRDQQGAFRNRTQLRQVPRLGAKTFEQAAGFLRIMNGDNPLDSSAVHPEAYPVVEQLVKRTGRAVKSLIGDAAFLRSLRAADFTDERFGEPTVKDILGELEKPGRDPRPEFRTAEFKEGVHELEHLTPGMILEGVVTNVTNFGAFVDIGVHQDGLVHVSALADRFVKDPREVVKAGDIVKVKVQDVDLKRRRIALSMRSGEAPSTTVEPPRREKDRRPQKEQRPQTAMAAAFAKIKLR